MRQLLEMAGPEQVSAHYESFWISRRYALGSIMLATGALMLQKVTDLNWVLRTWVAHIGMYAAIGIFFWVALVLLAVLLVALLNGGSGDRGGRGGGWLGGGGHAVGRTG